MELRNREIDITEEPRHIHIPRPSRLVAQVPPAPEQFDLCAGLLLSTSGDTDVQAA